MKKFILPLFLLLVSRLFGQPGTIDNFFNTGTGFEIGYVGIYSIILQPDGKILAGGEFGIYNGIEQKNLVRLNPDGSLDNSFNAGSGFLRGDTSLGYIWALAFQPDNKILAGGNFIMVNGDSVRHLVRLNTNGSIDTTFNIGTGFWSQVRTINILPDSKILVGGEFYSFNGNTHNRLVRLNSNGSLDNSFDIGLGFDDNVRALAIQDDQKILVGGNFTTVNGLPYTRMVRLNPNGSIDNSFNPGSGFDNNVLKLLVQPDGKILASGGFHSYDGTAQNCVVRLNPDGSLDQGFSSNTNQLPSLGTVWDFGVQQDNKLIYSTNAPPGTNGLIRVWGNGDIDNTFETGTGLNGIGVAYCITLQEDEKLLAGGDFTQYNGTLANRILRINSRYFFVALQSFSHATCLSNDGYISAAASGGIPPYSFEWNTFPPQLTDSLYGINPGLYTVTVTDSVNQTASSEFLLNGPSVFNGIDLAGHFTATSFRPGALSHIFLDASNQGCFPVNGNIKFVLSPLLNYLNSAPPADQVSGDTLIWSINNSTYDSLHFTALINVTTKLSAQIGDTLCLSLIALPVEQDGDNLMNRCYPGINSYDPNDKQVSPQATTSNNTKLYYNIRFQNTGNAEALTVNILDTISPNLDIQTLYIAASSHPVITQILPGNIVLFRFNNINLPDSSSNEPASHGFVFYEIQQIPDLQNGDTITNTAAIYFDNNEPIVTNTVVNIIRIATGTDDLALQKVTIYPNPATTQLTIRFSQLPEHQTTLEFIDIQGRLVNKSLVEWQTTTIPINLSPGLYILALKQNNHTVLHQRLIVK